MPNAIFASNLRLMCDQYRSVAQVCRSLEMNRQQFNKYLSGKIYPSKHNLARICTFFKLSEEQLNLEPDRFAELVSETFEAPPADGHSLLDQAVDSLPNSLDAMARYEGYYYSHFHALGNEDAISQVKGDAAILEAAP